MKRIAVTGSSGLIGTAVVAALTQRGDEVVRFVRRPARGRDEVQWDPMSRTLDPRALDGVDGVEIEVVSGGESVVRVAAQRPLTTDEVVAALAEAGDYTLVGA